MVVYGITNVHVWYVSIIFSKTMLPEVHNRHILRLCGICWNLGFFDVNTPYLRVEKCALWVHRKWEHNFFWGSAIRWKIFAIITHPNIIVYIIKYFEKVTVFLPKIAIFSHFSKPPQYEKKLNFFSVPVVIQYW